MGCAQMEKLPDYVAAKRRIAATYSDAFEGVPGIKPMQEAAWAHSTFWMYTILVDSEVFGTDSRGLLRLLDEARIQSRPLWQPLHHSKAFANCGSFDCPVADYLYSVALSLPCSVGVSDQDLQLVLAALVSSSSHSIRG